MITVEEAEEKISGELKPLAIETIPFECATGRILRKHIKADRALPPYDRVMMDGIALSSKDWISGCRSFRVNGLQLPGSPPLTLDKPDHCIKAMTGSVMPKGCDIIVPKEELQEQGEIIRVNREYKAKPRRFLHSCGSDCMKGDVLISPNEILGSKEIAVAASCGLEKLSVTRKIKIAVIDTGDELVEVGEPIKPYQIRRSNAHAITSACDTLPFVEAISTHCPDNPEIMNKLVSESLQAHDIVLLCGGVSKGDRDDVPVVLKKHGVEEHFHWVNQRPGKPLWFGRKPKGPLVFGLPGNPLSVLTCFHRYVTGALLGLAGATPSQNPTVSVIEPVEVHHTSTIFLPVTVHSGTDALLQATPQPPKNSGDFAAVIATDGFVQLPVTKERLPAGFKVPFFPW